MKFKIKEPDLLESCGPEIEVSLAINEDGDLLIRFDKFVPFMFLRRDGTLRRVACCEGLVEKGIQVDKLGRVKVI